MSDTPRTAVVPGMMQCAKCNFVLVRTNLYVRSGTAGPGGNETEPCPNGCGPLWPLTWEQHARELGKRLEQVHADFIAACEERDRYKADSEALDWLLRNFRHMINGAIKLARLDGHPAYSDCPEHLRKRLEEK